jgi:hypothetical protein
LFAEEAGNAAIAEAAKSLAQSRKLPQEKTLLHGCQPQQSEEQKEAKRPTTLMSMEKWKTS